MAWFDQFNITPIGVFSADFESMRTELVNSYLAIYGEDTYLGPDTKDGVWLSVLTLCAYDTFQQIEVAYNSLSPSTAIAAALFNNIKLNGMEQKTPSQSTVDVIISGTVGTLIDGGLVQDTLGQQWSIPTGTTIPLSGAITVTATAVEPGALTADTNTVTTILTITRGWLSVTNPAPAVPGNPVETPAQVRIRQTQSTNSAGNTLQDATISQLLALPGVLEVAAYQNPTGTTDSNGLPPYNICFIVEGGDVAEIGAAIANTKAPGVPTYLPPTGGVTVVVPDQYGNPNTINFGRPILAAIAVNIALTAKPGYLNSTGSLLQQAVYEYIISSPIGDDIFLSKIYTPANLFNGPLSNTYDITAIEMQKNGGGFSSANIILDFNEIPDIALGDIVLTVT